MTTSDLFKAVLGYDSARTASIYIVIDRVLLRIADHQANFINFECFNDIEDYDAIVNVVISDDNISDKEFESYLDKRDIQGEMIAVSINDNIKDISEYINSRVKYFA